MRIQECAVYAAAVAYQRFQFLTQAGLSDDLSSSIQFVKTTSKFFYGFKQQRFSGQAAHIATAEKALVDMIQLHRTYYTADRVAEILAGSVHMLDTPQLAGHLRQANLTTQRIFGFWFDRLGLPIDPDLAQRARSGQAASRLTADSTTYDHKWRLYYDNSIVERYASA